MEAKRIFEACSICPVRNSCSLEVEPGSVMCSINRMQSGLTHGDVEKNRCPHCGKPLN